MNLASVLLARAGSGPEAIALHADDGPVTYGELDARSGALAAAYLHGLEPGTRVGIVAGNGPAFVVAYLASLRAGMTAVPLDPPARPAELSRNLSTVGAGLVVASEPHRKHGGLDGNTVVALPVDGSLAGIAPSPNPA